MTRFAWMLLVALAAAMLVFMRGLIKADGVVVGSVDGIFKALTPRAA